MRKDVPEGYRQCGHGIDGPPVLGGRIVAWRKMCKRLVKLPERYCWQHKDWHKAYR